jgi:DNA primase
MEISEIKQKLSLESILKIYCINVDKNNMVKCPFHEDNTASLQVNLEKNFYKCHACGKKGDQIQWVQDYGNLTKREALLKCVDLIGELEPVNYQPLTKTENPVNQEARIAFLEKMFLSFRKGLMCSTPAKEYCTSRNLDFEKLDIGFNAGQFYHGVKKEEKLINDAVQCGLLSMAGTNSKTGGKAYKPFGNKSIVFPLKNKENQIVSFYFRSTINNENSKHFYLKNRQGIYPNYPNPDTKKLLLTEAIIDTASLLQIDDIKENYTLLTCYGTNGLTEEILNAIKPLKQLEEIIFFFDGDKSGNEAVKKYVEILRELHPTVTLSAVEVPKDEDINSLIIGHETDILIHLIDNRKEISFLFSIEEDIKVKVEKPTEKQQKNAQLPNTIDFLNTSNLIEKLNELLGKAGIIGEEKSRLLLFLITISYMNKYPLHALIQGTSGSGKTHLISRIADLMPQEDVLRFTRITESSLYNWGEYEMFRKVIIVEDLDGLKEEALYALREFISNQILRSLTSIKDKKGNNKSAHKIVKGQFSSLSATTKGETYEDNMSRSFLIAVDESAAQTARIIEYQNKRNAGEIDPKEQENTIVFIQSVVRNLKDYEVINPYATKLLLPEKVHKIRRLNEMYQAIIKQVTFLHQYQRRQTPEGKLITTIEDIQLATEILFESIVLKVDELDGSLRQFFERLKKYVKNENQEFLQREIRQEFNLSKTQLQRYINALLELEYIKQSGGYNNKGIKFKVAYWDNYQKLRIQIKEFLYDQIKALKPK